MAAGVELSCRCVLLMRRIVAAESGDWERRRDERERVREWGDLAINFCRQLARRKKFVVIGHC